MKKKKLLIVAVVAVIVLVGAIFIIQTTRPSGQQQGVTSQYITGITMASGASAAKEPVGVRSSFPTDIPEIAAITTFNKVPAATGVTYEWYQNDTDTVISGETRTTDIVFSGNSVSILKNTTGEWTRGVYEFRVLFGGQLAARQVYYIKSASDIAREEAASAITDIAFVIDVDVRGVPASAPQTVFDAEDDSIHAVVTYKKIDPDVELEARWIYVPESRTIDGYRQTLSGSGSFSFAIDIEGDAWLPAKKWAKGDYRLDIYLDGDLARGALFSVK